MATAWADSTLQRSRNRVQNKVGYIKSLCYYLRMTWLMRVTTHTCKHEKLLSASLQKPHRTVVPYQFPEPTMQTFLEVAIVPLSVTRRVQLCGVSCSSQAVRATWNLACVSGCKYQSPPASASSAWNETIPAPRLHWSGRRDDHRSSHCIQAIIC